MFKKAKKCIAFLEKFKVSDLKGVKSDVKIVDIVRPHLQSLYHISFSSYEECWENFTLKSFSFQNWHDRVADDVIHCTGGGSFKYAEMMHNFLGVQWVSVLLERWSIRQHKRSILFGRLSSCRVSRRTKYKHCFAPISGLLCKCSDFWPSLSRVQRTDEMKSLIFGCDFLLRNNVDESFTYHHEAIGIERYFWSLFSRRRALRLQWTVLGTSTSL